jgi:hypothetical protein
MLGNRSAVYYLRLRILFYILRSFWAAVFAIYLKVATPHFCHPSPYDIFDTDTSNHLNLVDIFLKYLLDQLEKPFRTSHML